MTWASGLASAQIEQPFAVLPLDSFCKVHKANLRHMTQCRQEALELLLENPPLSPPEQAKMVRRHATARMASCLIVQERHCQCTSAPEKGLQAFQQAGTEVWGACCFTGGHRAANGRLFLGA